MMEDASSNNNHHPMDDSQPVDEMMAGNNMVANLPLLFAAGYPTTLGKITEAQLEKFIPFMVQCSLGCIQINSDLEYSEPEWWPEHVPFVIPLRRPANIAPNDWHEELKEIVIICYSFHKVVYLLRFCNDLADYKPECLRFINNLNTTTSLFERFTNKLLVTFRNENMLYDSEPKTNCKKTLMPRQRNGGSGGGNGAHLMGADESDHHMVEPAPFDIYLCDYCDSELYSLEAYQDHERTCSLDDDVIYCGETLATPVSSTSSQPSHHGRSAAAASTGSTTTSATSDDDDETGSSSDAASDSEPPNVSEQLVQQAKFMQQFGLGNETVPLPAPGSAAAVAAAAAAAANNDDHYKSSPAAGSRTNRSRTAAATAMRRLPRRNRTVLGLTKCPSIAITSPAGQRLIKTSKSLVSEPYLAERLERMERFCRAPVLGQQQHQPPQTTTTTASGRKAAAAAAATTTTTTAAANPSSLSSYAYVLQLIAAANNSSAPFNGNNGANSSIPITFRRPATEDYNPRRPYAFPRRQFRKRTRDEEFRCLHGGEMRQCVPMTVRLEPLSDAAVAALQQRYARSIGGKPMTNFQRKQLARKRREQNAAGGDDASSSSAAARKRPRVEETVVDFIDLCSSEEEEESDGAEDADDGIGHNNNDPHQAPATTNGYRRHIDPVELLSVVGTVTPVDSAHLLGMGLAQHFQQQIVGFGGGGNSNRYADRSQTSNGPAANASTGPEFSIYCLPSSASSSSAKSVSSSSISSIASSSSTLSWDPRVSLPSQQPIYQPPARTTPPTALVVPNQHRKSIAESIQNAMRRRVALRRDSSSSSTSSSNLSAAGMVASSADAAAGAQPPPATLRLSQRQRRAAQRSAALAAAADRHQATDGGEDDDDNNNDDDDVDGNEHEQSNGSSAVNGGGGGGADGAAEAVLIYSNVTRTAMTLANHKRLYYQNEENHCGAGNSNNNITTNGTRNNAIAGTTSARSTVPAAAAGHPPHLHHYPHHHHHHHHHLQQQYRNQQQQAANGAETTASNNGGGGNTMAELAGLQANVAAVAAAAAAAVASVRNMNNSGGSIGNNGIVVGAQPSGKYLQMVAARPEIVLERLPTAVLQPHYSIDLT